MIYKIFKKKLELVYCRSDIMANLNDVIQLIRELSSKDKKKLLKIVGNEISANSMSMKAFLTGERFKKTRVCPHCGSICVVKNGHRKDVDYTQKYVCKDCKKSFTITTNAIVFGTRKDIAIWKEYIDCMLNGWNVRKCADECHIHRNTAFRWRHKILDALTNIMKNVTLDGIVEADEKYFPKSYKGNHRGNPKHKHTKAPFLIPRRTHVRGGMTEKRGISSEQVCVPCAVNKDGQSVAMPVKMGKPIPEAIHKVFDGRITSNSILCTDGEKSYIQFADDNKIELIQIKGGKGKVGNYHIQHINSYHSILDKFIDKFKGVSSKYLGNYIVWNNIVKYAKERDDEKAEIMFGYSVSYLMKERNVDIPLRPAFSTM